MRAKYAGNKLDKVMVNIRNKEATAVIPLGAPAMWNLTSTAVADMDGLDVVLPSTIGAANYQLCAGVNTTYNLAVNGYGEALVYGYSANTLVKLNTSATSTDTWASVAAVASGVILIPDFTNNVWQTLANVAAQSTPQNILVDVIASVASAVSTAGGTKLVSTGLYRSFVRFM
jgi:hypothetical protein